METGPDFDEFVRARSTALLRTAYALVGDYGHAEDMVQTALLRTARHWRQARDAPEAYARQVLINLCRDRWRWLRRRPPETALAEDAAPPSAGPADTTAEQVGEHNTLLRALARLPAGQRQVIVLIPGGPLGGTDRRPAGDLRRDREVPHSPRPVSAARPARRRLREP